jgi:hypothetical protein
VTGAGLWLAIGVAGAAPPAALRWTIEPPAVEEAFSAAARGRGEVGPSAVPACEPVGQELLACAWLPAAGGWRLASMVDVMGWGKGLSDLLHVARAEVRAAWAARPPERAEVEGGGGVYLLRAAGDGQDTLGLLIPDAIDAAVGAPAVVAVPRPGVLIAWKPGDPDLDKILAVGARRIADGAADRISARVYRWDGARWVIWGEVRGSLGDLGSGPAAG